MKRLLTTILALCAFSITLIGQTSSHRVEILIEGNMPLKVVSKAKGTTAGTATWYKKNTENYITATILATDNEWKEIKFAVEPSQNGKLEIFFRSNFFRNKDGMIVDMTPQAIAEGLSQLLTDEEKRNSLSAGLESFSEQQTYWLNKHYELFEGKN